MKVLYIICCLVLLGCQSKIYVDHNFKCQTKLYPNDRLGTHWDIPKTLGSVYEYPCFNKNSNNEIIFYKNKTQQGQLIKYNFKTEQQELLVDSITHYQGNWSNKDWVIYSKKKNSERVAQYMMINTKTKESVLLDNLGGGVYKTWTYNLHFAILEI